MNLSLIRSMTRSAVFELENGLCFAPFETKKLISYFSYLL